MSRVAKVAFIVEGPTDQVILLAVVDALLGEITPRYIQPPRDVVEGPGSGGNAGVFGGGWKGVRS